MLCFTITILTRFKQKMNHTKLKTKGIERAKVDFRFDRYGFDIYQHQWPIVI